jgi:hypothetical protein
MNAGREKAALYGNNLQYPHAPRQLLDAKWTSKLSKAEDTEHDTPDVVAGGSFGEVLEITSSGSRLSASPAWGKTDPETTRPGVSEPNERRDEAQAEG